MSSLNTKRTISLVNDLTNITILKRSIMSTMLWEDNFYEDGISISTRIQELIQKCYNEGKFESIIYIIKQAKFDMRLRHIPLFCIRELARLKLQLQEKKQLSLLLIDCITRADDITEFMAMYFTDNTFKETKQPIAAFITEALQKAFLKFNEYSLAKYSGYKKKISLKDVLCLVRPKPMNDEQSILWKKLLSRSLKTPDTWEVELSKSKDQKASWERLINESKLGGLALLRNIRNINDAGVDPLLTINAIKNLNTKYLLPINFISSALINPQFTKQLEEKFVECFSKDKMLKGKTVILLDVSGSMNSYISEKSKMTRKDIAASIGIIANNVCEYCAIFGFSDQLIPLSNSSGFNLIQMLRRYNGGTNLYQAIAFFKDADFDRVIVITDEQATDQRQPDIILNPNKTYYIINIAPYQKGIQFRTNELNNVVKINGWSDSVIDYILEIENYDTKNNID
jgi:hypothetical protein